MRPSGVVPTPLATTVLQPRLSLADTVMANRKPLGERVMQDIVNPLAALGNLPQRPASAYMAEMQDPNSEVRRNAMAAALAGITAYHGSPYKFDKFDMSKIGTGEGAQAYGHGLYFAENPSVASYYQPKGMKLSVETKYRAFDPLQSLNENERAAGRLLAEAKGNPDKAMAMALRLQGKGGHEIADVLDSWSKEGILSVKEAGSLYKVDIPDEAVGKMLDWDKPLSQQPESVRKILADKWWAHPQDHAHQTGAQIYRILANELGSSEKAGLAMRQAGIPGIKYLDQGSRGTGQGTSNFVLFDENLAKILERK